MNPLMEAEETALNAYERNMAGANSGTLGAERYNVGAAMEATPAAQIIKYYKPEFELVPMWRQTA